MPPTNPASRWRRRWLPRRRRTAASPLTGVPPFDHYEPRALAPLAPYVDRLRPRPGTVLAHEGWMAREVLVVVAGEVEAARRGRSLRRFGPGEQVGAAELLCGAAHLATLVAGDDLEVVVVNGPAYRWAARSLPALAPPTVTGTLTDQPAAAAGPAGGPSPVAGPAAA
jgi:CRP-like cAMP-binding protein